MSKIFFLIMVFVYSPCFAGSTNEARSYFHKLLTNPKAPKVEELTVQEYLESLRLDAKHIYVEDFLGAHLRNAAKSDSKEAHSLLAVAYNSTPRIKVEANSLLRTLLAGKTTEEKVKYYERFEIPEWSKSRPLAKSLGELFAESMPDQGKEFNQAAIQSVVTGTPSSRIYLLPYLKKVLNAEKYEQVVAAANKYYYAYSLCEIGPPPFTKQDPKDLKNSSAAVASGFLKNFSRYVVTNLDPKSKDEMQSYIDQVKSVCKSEGLSEADCRVPKTEDLVEMEKLAGAERKNGAAACAKKISAPKEKYLEAPDVNHRLRPATQ